MKKASKIAVAIGLIVIIVASYFVGCHITEQKNSRTRTERCRTLITFAIDKAENEDLTDQGVMKALISNVYAAYQFCDESKSVNQLHDLWNYLIFESNSNIDNAKEITLRELNAVLHSIEISK